jgi:hypothetical protein
MKTVNEMQKFAKLVLEYRKKSEKEAHDMCVEILKEMGVTETNQLVFRDCEGCVIDDALCYTSVGTVGQDVGTVKLSAIWLDNEGNMRGEVVAEYDDADTDTADTNLEEEYEMGYIYLLDFLLDVYTDFLCNGNQLPNYADEV